MCIPLPVGGALGGTGFLQCLGWNKTASPFIILVDKDLWGEYNGVLHGKSTPHIINKNGATSGFEMCFAPSTVGAGGPNQNTSRIQH